MKKLPLVLCGPIVRSVGTYRVSCWIAVKERCDIELNVFESDHGQKGALVATGSASTISVLPHLHVSLVSAYPVDQSNPLNSGRRYLYDLRFRNESLGDKGLFDEKIYSLEEQLIERRAGLVYPGQVLPGFCLLSSSIKDLRFVQGSCRKPHGKGKDAFISLDSELQQSILNSDNTEPQFLMLTGDQVYADDVKPELLSKINATVFDLLDGEDNELHNIIGAFGDDLRPGKRQKLVTRRTEFSANKKASHVLSLAEFIGLYLYSWSDVFWRNQSIKDRSLQEFRAGLTCVRRVLANVSTYMIFDDHEVTDDWNRTEYWIDKVGSSSLGNRVVTNALVTYFVFQHWGNVPSKVEERGAESKILMLLDGWHGVDENIRRQLSSYIYVPESGNLLNEVPDTAISWVYKILQSNYQIVVLDTRTRRFFDSEKGFPGLISQQVQDEVFSSLDKTVSLTLVVSPAPVLGERLIEFLQKWLSKSGDGTSHGNEFDGEAWAFHKPSYNALIENMMLLRRVIVLSGDVHYAFGSSFYVPTTDARIINFVSSSMRNRAFGKTLSKILSLFNNNDFERTSLEGLEIPSDLTRRKGSVLGAEYEEELLFDSEDIARIGSGEILKKEGWESAPRPARRKRSDVIGQTNFALITFLDGKAMQSVRWNDRGRDRETLHIATMDVQ